MRVGKVEVSPRAALIVLAAGSAVLRFAVALQVRTPLYYPDEYIHTALARSIVDGTFPDIRGGSVSFFSYLGPLFMSPAWLIGNVHVAHRVAQAMGCVAFATAAFPAYLLARRLGISVGGALASALLVLAIPDGAFTVGLLAEPYAYPLFLLGVLVAVDAIASPSVFRQLAVVGMMVVLPLVAGAQFFVYGLVYLPAAYLAGPWSPRAFVARQRVVLLSFACALAGVAADIFVHGSGRIANVWGTATVSFRYPPLPTATWFGIDIFVLALAAGWIVVPAAVLGFRRMLGSPDRRHRAFAVTSLLLVICFVLEATPFGVNANTVLERYAFYGAPLIAIAFVWALESGLARGRAYALLACAGAVVVFLLPVSSTMLGRTIDEAPSLLGLSQFGIGGASATVVWAPVLTVLTLAVAAQRIPRWGLILAAAAVSVAIGVGVSRDYTRISEHQAVPPTVAPADSALVTWAGADQTVQMQLLFWNRDISRVLVIGGGAASDGYPAVDATLAPGPAFLGPGRRRLAGPFVFGPNVLVAAPGVPIRQRSVVALTGAPSVVATNWNRLTGELGPSGSIEAVAGRRPMRIAIRLRIAAGAPKTIRFQCRHGYDERIRVGGKLARVRIPVPRHELQVCTFASSGPFNLGHGSAPDSITGRLALQASTR